MAFLLDTHVFLWYLSNNPSLSQKAKEIVDTKSDLFFSVASLWEIVIKINVGKLQLDCSFESFLDHVSVMNAEIIPIEIESLKIYLNLPLSPEHRDPFDRILVAQAMDYSLDIVSRDEKFDSYPIQRVWA
ncbi:type II toxin-antitoxin system VapC family toxin [Prochlorothrix hollandica]|uniref:Twitching motility protein PilT n=1 Tax=Prochlorothrix hollandica PCC 9006 = CALU 1027 TaxID=317619 RepID=A0A0M2PYY5_PROHO|nr:type II toxin-antitoxin system VapC family toxin [Prochlorothrix hollandica]KKI99601.1 twitching motility protein PilT [Prochlorothrix hollandica PCC 9006 = CALU 1027]